MMSEQNIKKLGELCDFVRGPFGGSLKKSCFKADGYAVYEQQHAIYDQFDEIRYFIDEDKFEEMKRFELKSGDLIMSCSGTMGKVAIVPNGVKRGVINQALLKLTPNQNLEVEYLRYWMQSPSFTEGLKKHTVGAAIKNVASVKILKTLELPAPPLPEQKRIVAKLDKAFEAINKAKVNLERNLQNAKDLFQSKLNEIFGQKGDGWVEKRLEEICSIKHGFAFKSQYFAKSGSHVVLTPGSFYEKGGFRDQGEKTKFYTGDIPSDYVLNEGDFLFAMTEQAVGLLGSSLVVPKSGYYLHNQRLGLVQTLENVKWDNSFFSHLFNTMSFRRAVQLTASGVKVRHTSPKKLGAIQVSFPEDIDEQKRISSKLNMLASRTQRVKNKYNGELIALEELKKSILQKAFNGEI